VPLLGVELVVRVAAVGRGDNPSVVRHGLCERVCAAAVWASVGGVAAIAASVKKPARSSVSSVALPKPHARVL